MAINNKSLPIFSVQFFAVRQWGDAQQKSLDGLLVWSATLEPPAGLKILEQIRAVLIESGVGTIHPITDGAQKALDAMGKDEQILLLKG